MDLNLALSLAVREVGAGLFVAVLFSACSVSGKQ